MRISRSESANVRSVLQQTADVLDSTERFGEDVDEPEGARWIKISDTCAKKLAVTLRVAASGVVSLDPTEN